jgi:periplasmic divalent cation tolerance protein
MWIAWTTVDTRDNAERLALSAMQHRLAACVQVEGPVVSMYWWQGKLERGEEWRLMFKCTPEQLSLLETRIHTEHPYETPEWIAIRAEHVGEKYLNWAFESSSLGDFSNESTL